MIGRHNSNIARLRSCVQFIFIAVYLPYSRPAIRTVLIETVCVKIFYGFQNKSLFSLMLICRKKHRAFFTCT